jgi:ABC-2 type transport system permease protein
MARNVLFLARFELLHGLRQRETLAWTFLMPLVFFFFFSKMSGIMGGGGRGERKDPLRLEVPADAGFLADEIAQRLGERGYVVERVEPGHSSALAKEDDETSSLALPAALTERALAGETSVLTLQRDAGGIRGNYDDFRVGRAVYTVLADLVAVRSAGEEPSPETFRALRERPRALTLSVKPAGARRTTPTGKQQSIPGTMTMFTLVLLLTSGCVPIVLERRSGLLRRLASTPIARGELVAGRWLATFGLGVVQTAWALVAGAVLFGMDWGPRPIAVGLFLVPWVALCSSLALLLGVLARTESQVIGIGVLASNVLAALGGCWWPIEIAPGWMQRLALALPTGWVMDGLHRLISFQQAPSEVVPHALAMGVAALAAGALGARRFRYL